jgi:hypothetical protein
VFLNINWNNTKNVIDNIIQQNNENIQLYILKHYNKMKDFDHMRELSIKIFPKLKCNTKSRKFCFNWLLNLAPSKLIKIALDNHLTKQELEKLYYNQKSHYINRVKSKAFLCSTIHVIIILFKEFLTKKEINLIVKYLKKYNPNQGDKSTLKAILNENPPDSIKQTIESILIINQLQGGNNNVT